jgi:uncharacterized protein (DUF2236 family)
LTETILPSEEELPELVPPPGSITWRKAGDVRLMGSAGYALLLQVAHPTVGAGVAQFSHFQSDPWGRLFRTLDYVNGTIYGGPELAGEIGRRVRAMHRNFKGVRPDGRPFHALEPDAYAWVHATLASSIVDGHRLFGTALSADEEVQFWGEWRRLGRLIGVRDRDLPQNWEDYRAYFDSTVENVLEDNETVHAVLDSLARPAVPPPGMPGALWRVVAPVAGRQSFVAAVGLLPPMLRARFGLRWTVAHEAVLRTIAAASRASGPLLPRQLREFGPVYVRWRRDALEPSRY